MNTTATTLEFSQDMKQVLDLVPTMIWVAGPEGDCHHVNHAWLEFTGRKLEEAVGTGWLALMHPEDACSIRDKVQTQRPFSLDCRLRRRDGRYRWLHKSAHPLFAADGRCLGFIGHNIDVSHQKQALEALHQARQKQRTLLSSLREAVTVVEDFLHTGEQGGGAHSDDRLTPRQREILHLIARGYATREIATQLHVSVKTVESHRAQLMQRLNIHDVAGLTRYAIRTGLVPTDL